MPRRPRRYYSRAFKLEVLHEIIDGVRSSAEVARAHDLEPGLVRGWKMQLRAELVPAAGPAIRDPRAEAEVLRREVTVLREENDILKKAAAFLAPHLV
jgi:transposase-like protein